MRIPLKQIESFIQQLPKTIDWPAEEIQFVIEMASSLYILARNTPPQRDFELPIVTFRKNISGNNWQWLISGFKMNMEIIFNLIEEIQFRTDGRYVRPDAVLTLLPKKDFILYPNYKRIHLVNHDDDLPHVMHFERSRDNDDWELIKIS